MVGLILAVVAAAVIYLLAAMTAVVAFRGKPGSRGGTQISGNTIYGGQIVSDKTLGRG